MNERDVVEMLSSIEMAFDGSSVTIHISSANGSFLTESMIKKEVIELIEDAFPKYDPEKLDS